MTAEQFEAANKKQIVEEINKKDNLTQEEKDKLVTAKLKEVVDKLVREQNDKKVEAYQDEVKFGTLGWKERYYALKFHVSDEQELKKFRRGIRQAYIEGLAWVYAYYYEGCVSWHWFYPYHYAPFASDLLGCDQLEIKFERGEPVKPFEQLLSVFPKQSCHAVPSCYHKLYEDNSPIIDFYPKEVTLDINGARYAWMGVNLLPFIERQRLVDCMNEADKNEANLTAHEKERNRRFGDIKLFFKKNIYNKQGTLISAIEKAPSPEYYLEASFKCKDTIAGKIQLVDPEKSMFPYGASIQKAIGSFEVNVSKNQCHVVHMTHPQYKEHSTKLL